MMERRRRSLRSLVGYALAYRDGWAICECLVEIEMLKHNLQKGS